MVIKNYFNGKEIRWKLKWKNPCVVTLALEFVVLCGCSLRQTVKLLPVIYKVFGRQDVEVPSFRSVSNWLIKAGYGA
ncbi:MAG: hypothetical protein LBL62_08135, partial [Planctomycetaceae bacterium]|nr:hypothetical protein [Planctomycetaceae bacterium]